MASAGTSCGHYRARRRSPTPSSRTRCSGSFTPERGGIGSTSRALWASTSTKSPRYRDTTYVEGLIGPATVNTMPVQTFEAFRDHGRVALTLQQDVEGARHVLDQLAMAGIDLAAITQELEDEGVTGFAKSFRESIEQLGKVRAAR